MNSDKIKELRDTFRKKRVVDNVEVMNDLKPKLMSLSDFDDKLQSMYDNKEYANFVVNYLFRHFGVRNKDIDVTILNRKKDMDDGNYLWIRPKIGYIRRDYKTKSSYGEKKYEITDKQVSCCRTQTRSGTHLEDWTYSLMYSKRSLSQKNQMYSRC
jgi:hypothetical protein